MNASTPASKQDALQAMLLQLRNSFLDELPEKFDRLEHLLLEMEKQGASSDAFNEAYRIVHSLKGSGGTFGLHIITTICHQMEDLLNTAGDGEKSSSSLIAISLKYLDLLRLAVTRIEAGDSGFPEIEQYLADLRQQANPRKFSVLLASHTKLETGIFMQALAGFPVHTVVVNDGLEALTRAISEPFDLVITANEISRLNGVALVGALNLSDSSHARCKTILITSNKAFAKSGKRDTDADYTIFKDGKLMQNLAGAVKRALSIPAQE